MDAVALETADGFEVDKAKAAADLAEMTMAAHPFGSERQLALGTWLRSRIAETGATAKIEAFSSETPNPAALAANSGPVSATMIKNGANIYALGVVKPDAPCVIAFGSHYDTKIVEATEYVGANDSGSSSVLLLQLLAYLRTQVDKLDVVCDLAMIWFDGEEAVLRDWYDGERLHPAKIRDNTYGSRHAAGRLKECAYEGAKAKCLPEDLGGKPLVALVLLDMIGSPGLLLARETHSTDQLVQVAVNGAASLGFKDRFSSSPTAIEDDHVPFLTTGVAAVNLIDFTHLDVWHRAGDDADLVSMESLKIAGQIAIVTALTAARTPKELLASSEE